MSQRISNHVTKNLTIIFKRRIRKKQSTILPRSSAIKANLLEHTLFLSYFSFRSRYTLHRLFELSIICCGILGLILWSPNSSLAYSLMLSLLGFGSFVQESFIYTSIYLIFMPFFLFQLCLLLTEGRTLIPPVIFI